MSTTIIIGGGVIGLLTAYELQKAGEKVTVIDRKSVGQESSWAGGGILSPLYPWRYPEPVTQLATLSQALYPELIEQMQQRTGKDAEYLPSGMLVLGDYDSEQAEQWVSSHRVDAEKINQQQIRELAPEVSTDFDSGWWFPRIHQVRNPRLIALIKAYLQTTDVKLIENEAIDDILTKDGLVSAVKTATSSYQADRFVIAGGAWSSQLLLQTGIEIGVKPVKGQMLLLKGSADLVRHITLSEDRYIIPRKDGRILVGSTTEDCGFDKSISEEVRQQLLDYANRSIPALKSLRIEKHWGGLRPGSSNGIPKIGRHPEISNLFINCGHYRNGLVIAPASARLLASMMLNHQSIIDPKHYSPCDAAHKNK